MLHVGNTKPHKNLERLVRAVARLRDVTLICSSAPAEELVRLATNLGCADRLRFLDGIAEAELPAWYRGASAVVIPSLYEGFGLPALEGMASGVPVVASSTTALGELVGDAGVLVEPTDVDSITDGIDAALTDDALRLRLATASPTRAAEYRWDAVASAVTAAIGSAER